MDSRLESVDCISAQIVLSSRVSAFTSVSCSASSLFAPISFDWISASRILVCSSMVPNCPSLVLIPALSLRSSIIRFLFFSTALFSSSISACSFSSSATASSLFLISSPHPLSSVVCSATSLSASDSLAAISSFSVFCLVRK